MNFIASTPHDLWSRVDIKLTPSSVPPGHAIRQCVESCSMCQLERHRYRFSRLHRTVGVKSHGLIGLWFLKMATWFSRKSRKSTSSTWQTPLLVFPPFRSPLQKEANLSAAGGYVNNATMKLSPQGERSENTGKTRRSEMVRWDGQVWLKGHHY